VNPAGERDGLPDVCRAQFVAMMRAFHEIIFAERTPSLAGNAPDFKAIYQGNGLANGTDFWNLGFHYRPFVLQFRRQNI
jgi:hypothetical protein